MTGGFGLGTDGTTAQAGEATSIIPDKTDIAIIYQRPKKQIYGTP
jgi:hypothetical protein